MQLDQTDAQSDNSARLNSSVQPERGPVSHLNVDLCSGLAPYSAVKAVIDHYIMPCPDLRSAARVELQRLDKVLLREASDYGFGKDSTDGSSVAFAVLRRVSRESVYTARYIDSCADLVSRYLSDLPRNQTIVISGISEVDRLSLKTLIRAVAKLPEDIQARVTIQEEGCEVTTEGSASRLEISERLTESLLGRRLKLGLGRCDALKSSQVVEIAQNIVLQNFDRGIDNSTEDPEVFRLKAIAEVNTGKYQSALSLLELAKSKSETATYSAHLDYLSGLVSTKRHYDINTSNRWFESGLKRLEGNANLHGADLEHAWLLNGKALNSALKFRKTQATTDWDLARELAFTAFGVIADVKGRAYDYLRFNLLANIALLFEMKGEFDVALEVFEQTFASSQSEDMKDEAVGSHFCYRMALLKAKLKRFDEADLWLSTAREKAIDFGCPFSEERIARAEVALAHHRKIVGMAGPNLDAVLSRGLRLAQQNFARDGIQFYENFEMNAEKIRLNDDLAAYRLVSPKMPAYIPEVDFEDLPKVDLNKNLSSASYAS